MRGVEEELPLKQGLKQNLADRNYNFDIVEEELPLKQGLKLNQSLIIHPEER